MSLSTTVMVHGLGHAEAAVGYAGGGAHAHLAVGQISFILASDRSTVADLDKVREQLRKLTEAIDEADNWLIQRIETLTLCADRGAEDFGGLCQKMGLPEFPSIRPVSA